MPAEPHPSKSTSYKSVLLILGATLGIVLMNTCAKKSGGLHGPIEMVFYRGVIALAILVPYMLLTRPRAIFRPRRWRPHLYRAVAGNLGVGFVFWAYTLLPMADATALLFAAPLFVTALSPLLLKERVDAFRWAAVLVGFLGIVIIVKPSGNLFTNPASLIGLIAALCVGIVDIALRHLGKTDDPLTTVFYFLSIGVAISCPFTLFSGSAPTVSTLPWIVGIGVFAAFQQLAKTTALRNAEASFLAPYTYTSILWATMAGWFFWKELPTLSVLIGTTVIITSNLFILFREK